MSLYVVEHEQGCDDVEVQEYDRDRDVYSLTSQNRSADSFFPQPFFIHFGIRFLADSLSDLLRATSSVTSCPVYDTLISKITYKGFANCKLVSGKSTGISEDSAKRSQGIKCL